jgi:hypothetical protein
LWIIPAWKFVRPKNDEKFNIDPQVQIIKKDKKLIGLPNGKENRIQTKKSLLPWDRPLV